MFAGGQDEASERDGLRGNDRRRRLWNEKFQLSGGREKGARRMPENGKRSYNGITIRNNINDNNSDRVKGGQRVKIEGEKTKNVYVSLRAYRMMKSLTGEIQFERRVPVYEGRKRCVVDRVCNTDVNSQT